MSVDYLSVLKAAEAFTDDDTPWDVKFRNLVEKSVKEQADAFKLRFALQLEKQGVDCKDMVVKVNAVADIFTEKSKAGNGKSLKYGSVEFGDVLKEFLPDSTLSFVERKKEFKDFDLDNNGYVDVVEFLLFLYKPQVVEGYKARHGLTEINTENEAEALIREFVNIAVLVDTKLDEQILALANLKAEFERDMQAIKDDAKSEVKKRQLSNNLKAREAKYNEDQKAFYSDDQLGKSKLRLLKRQEEHLKELEALIEQEAADALKPKHNLQMP